MALVQKLFKLADEQLLGIRSQTVERRALQRVQEQGCGWQLHKIILHLTEPKPRANFPDSSEIYFQTIPLPESPVASLPAYSKRMC